MTNTTNSGTVSLCTGIAGLDLAARNVFPDAGGLVAVTDVKPAAARWLAHRLPRVPNLGDLTTAPWAEFRGVDLMTFGWPCQPHSPAGKRLGEEDPRAIWPAVADAVSAARPAILIGENVARIATSGELRRVIRSLARLGYVGAWGVLAACDAGAAHWRKRITLVAADPGQRGLDDLFLTSPETFAGRSVDLLPTPTARNVAGVDNRVPDPNRTRGLDLQTTVTRAVTTGEWPGRFAPALERWASVLGRPAPDPVVERVGGVSLSPALVEWLMGYPAGWVTGVEGLTRSDALSLLGDSVVPQSQVRGIRLLLPSVAARVAEVRGERVPA